MKVASTTSGTTPLARGRDLARASRLEYVSVGYNVLEAAAGVAFGLAAGSVALVGFGLDSVVEASSATILLWRLRTEVSGRRTAAEAEGRAIRLVAVAFFALAAYVGVRSAWDLFTGARPEESIPGIVLAAASLVIMPVLARAKRRLADRLNSRSLQADSMQTVLCTYLSAFLLLGLAANALWGWWWADPTAGLAIAVIAVREGLVLWRERDLCC
jgi:divalent metal cation (Fe/Co/Zn/Cd) transporter